MRHASGLEINLIVNAAGDAPNILIDGPEKYAGFTHVALTITDLSAAATDLRAAGIEITGQRGADPVSAIFIRDPDRNVIELAAD
jgi:lactoylglutathione lyase